MANQIQQSLSLLRLHAVMARTGLSRSSLYLKIAERSFPRPVSLGPRAVAWPSDLIDRWVSERIAQGPKG